MDIAFDNSYATLPARFFTRQAPVPVAAPRLFALNGALAQDLGIDAEALSSEEGVEILAGNAVPDGAAPLAQVYAGHQFGGWSPQLGDGRAILLGEVIDRHGHRRDLQLKGSGQTPYSRRGDGRAWLGPVIREYIVSEAMHALGIPTTRALAAVTTGEDILREQGLVPGAVLTRVAASHIRVGTFQYFASKDDPEALEALTRHAIDRHYPDADGALGLLDKVVGAQADLIAGWMGVGFIHGVMNTDNMTISGETIDYGPCAFMDAYHPATVFSSIDQFGRYAWNAQADIAVWNLAQLATALLPLIDTDRDAAIAAATPVVNAFADRFNAAWERVLRAKLGLERQEDGDLALASDLLSAMAANQADFTLTFRALSGGAPRAARELFVDPTAFDDWFVRYETRLASEPRDESARQAAMARTNPAIIPRNHRVEEAIAAAVAGDRAPFDRLHSALATPFDDPVEAALTHPPQAHEVVQRTFCGT